MCQIQPVFEDICFHKRSCILHDGNPPCFAALSGKNQHRTVSWDEIPDRKVYDLLDSGAAVIHQAHQGKIPPSMDCILIRLLQQKPDPFRGQVLHYGLPLFLYRDGKHFLVVVQGFR